ncbi:serine hydrolase domain-containing protein [Paludibaculum fermentans]|uniref:serine hydrolase domain-containing protein n=1 Tax=Paludibaculum fermentans TaxID=1473598 RepID=UPI003EBD824B
MHAKHAFLILIGLSASLAAQTGTPVPQLQAFDDRLPPLMEKWNVPGSALAIAKDGKLIFARGYGLANVEAREAVQPDSLFRIASVSKPITATGVMKLVEAGKLDLDAKIYPILRDLIPPRGQLADQRLKDITVRDLLRHTGGWDDHAIEPLKYLMTPVAAAEYFDMPAPPSARMLTRYAFSNMPLDNEPAAIYAYSNFGYTLLGRVIEEISGLRYEEYIRREVLAPAGITKMSISGNSPETAQPGEVRYYDFPDATPVPSIFPEGPRYLSAPYDMDLAMMDSFGGWAASAVDLLRFSEAFDGRRGQALLKPETIDVMMAHDWRLWPGTNFWYGLGWKVQPVGDRVVWFHEGEHRGNQAFLAHWPNGISVAVVFNSCPQQTSDFLQDVINSINTGLGQVREWPDHDLFTQYDPPPAQ